MNQLSLLAEPAARATDPSTSHAAAETVRRGASRLEARIVEVVRERGPVTADDICAELASWYSQTVKSALSRVRRRGEVVPAGEGLSARGCRMTTWAAAP